MPPAAALPAGKNAMLWTFSYETSTGDTVDDFRMSNLALPASRGNTAPTSFTVP